MEERRERDGPWREGVRWPEVTARELVNVLLGQRTHFTLSADKDVGERTREFLFTLRRA